MNVEFSTQLIKSYDFSEQRISKRAQARYDFTADYFLLGEEVQQAKALLHSSTPQNDSSHSGLGHVRMPWYKAPSVSPVLQGVGSGGTAAATVAFDNPGTPVILLNDSGASTLYWLPGGTIDDNSFPPFSEFYFLRSGLASDVTNGFTLQVSTSWSQVEVGATGNFVNSALVSWGSSTNLDPATGAGYMPGSSSALGDPTALYPIIYGYLEGSLASYRSEGNDLARATVRFKAQDSVRPAFTFNTALGDTENYRRRDILSTALDYTDTTLFTTNYHADAANGGYPLIDSLPYLQQDSSTSITTIAPTKMQDNKVSTRFVRQRHSGGTDDTPFIGANPTTSELNFVCNNKDEANDLLRWIRDMRGKQKCFWRRSWSADFDVVDMGTYFPFDIGNPTANRLLTVVVEPNGYCAPTEFQSRQLFYNPAAGDGTDADNVENRPYQAVSLRFKDGTYFNSLVLNVEGPGGAIDPPIFNAGNVAEAEFPGKDALVLEWDPVWNDLLDDSHLYENLLEMSYLHLCRFANDSFSFVEDEAGVVRVNTTIVEGIKNVLQ